MANAPRRIGAEGSATRALILDAAEQVLRECGYAAASTRRVAGYAGLKPSLVHYYFPSTDDMLLALSERGAEKSDQMLDEALASEDPLLALWHFFTDSSRTEITLEAMAMANRRDALRAQMSAHCEAMRAREVAAITQVLAEKAGGRLPCPPAAISLILAGIGRALTMEGALGVSSGHQQAREWVEKWIQTLVDPDSPSA